MNDMLPGEKGKTGNEIARAVVVYSNSKNSSSNSSAISKLAIPLVTVIVNTDKI